MPEWNVYMGNDSRIAVYELLHPGYVCIRNLNGAHAHKSSRVLSSY